MPTKSTTTAKYSTTDSPTHPAVSTENATVVGVSAKTPTDNITATGTFILTKGPLDNTTQVPTDAALVTKRPTNVAASALPTDNITSTDALVLTKDPTKRSTDAVVLTIGPADNTTSENPTNTAVATDGSNNGAVITKVPTEDSNIPVMSTEDPIESVVLTKGPIDNKTTNGPSHTGDGVAAGAGLLVIIVNITCTLFC